MLAIGSEVVVQTFGNKRGVITEASGDGRYRVRVEAISVWCREADLRVADARAKKRGTKPRDERAEPAPSNAPPARVDLHGLTVEEALARLVGTIDRALQDGADRVEVVHGKGSGRIKNAVHRHLKTMSVVKAFKLDQANPGVTWVYF